MSRRPWKRRGPCHDRIRDCCRQEQNVHASLISHRDFTFPFFFLLHPGVGVSDISVPPVLPRLPRSFHGPSGVFSVNSDSQIGPPTFYPSNKEQVAETSCKARVAKSQSSIRILLAGQLSRKLSESLRFLLWMRHSRSGPGFDMRRNKKAAKGHTPGNFFAPVSAETTQHDRSIHNIAWRGGEISEHSSIGSVTHGKKRDCMMISPPLVAIELMVGHQDAVVQLECGRNAWGKAQGVAQAARWQTQTRKKRRRGGERKEVGGSVDYELRNRQGRRVDRTLDGYIGRLYWALTAEPTRFFHGGGDEGGRQSLGMRSALPTKLANVCRDDVKRAASSQAPRKAEIRAGCRITPLGTPDVLADEPGLLSCVPGAHILFTHSYCFAISLLLGGELLSHLFDFIQVVWTILAFHQNFLYPTCALNPRSTRNSRRLLTAALTISRRAMVPLVPDKPAADGVEDDVTGWKIFACEVMRHICVRIVKKVNWASGVTRIFGRQGEQSKIEVCHSHSDSDSRESAEEPQVGDATLTRAQSLR
ncbi:hypothetical protein C8R47DRAFT_1080180 [Mycena vitilis]|nr:hypothetical protein C8R47DRAFT_1080180 [Mycena vitilis]